MFCYQKNFVNPTLPVDEAQFYALVRATQWNENIDKYRETHDAALKRKLLPGNVRRNEVEGWESGRLAQAGCYTTDRTGGDGRGPCGESKGGSW